MTATEARTLEAYFATDAFGIAQATKERLLLDDLVALTEHHRRACPPYASFVAAVHGDGAFDTIADLPALPVRSFKTHRLASIPDDEVFKTLTSSGTTGDAVSRIFLDRAAASLQTKALNHTMRAVFGRERLPMLVADSASVVKDRRTFSARGAGVVGMMPFGRDHAFALDDEMRLDQPAVRSFLERHGDQPFLVFGFTFMVWLHLYEPARAAGLDLSKGTLVHSGGWKKMVEQSVDPATFRRLLGDDTGLTRIHNFYGMVEQIGSVFLEGPEGDGTLYPPAFADVIVRDPVTWREAEVGEVGVIEVVSALPSSYPGHVLLTEDLGVVHGVDDGPHWRGKRLSVVGRVPRAEVRGCSDTFAGGR